MPQRTQHGLVHVLLLWTAVLSIMQVAFIVFYFTVGQLPSENGFALEKGEMLTFAPVYANDCKRAKWMTKNANQDLVSGEDVLTVKKDGYYFLNLQVTLSSCVNKTTVSLKWNGNELLMQGWINSKPCSTGLLGKVEELSAGGTLEVTIEPETCINTNESAGTHLDIIYMLKP